MLLFEEHLPLAVHLYALGTLGALWARDAPHRKHHFDSPLALCVHALLVVVAVQAIPGWFGAVHQVSVAMLPALARYVDGQLGFRLVNLVGLQALFQASGTPLSLQATGFLLHLCLLAADLDAQGWHDLHSVVRSALYTKEIALSRLGHIRELTIDDFWALPERLRLQTAHQEFKYDQDETLFIFRAIVRMMWRPYLPLLAVQSLFRISEVMQSVIFTKALQCIEDSSNRAWYWPYLYLLTTLVLQLVNTQSSRISQLLAEEAHRTSRAVVFELVRVPLVTAGKHGETSFYLTWLVDDLIRQLEFIVLEVPSIATATFTLWLTYRTIGCISFIPIAVTLILSLLTWAIGQLQQWCGRPYHGGWIEQVDSSEIYRNIKTIKFNSWEQRYLDPALATNRYSDRLGSSAISKRYRRVAYLALKVVANVNDILQSISSQLAVFFTVQLHIQSGRTLSSMELLQVADQISQTNNNMESVISELRSLSEAITTNIQIEGCLRTEPTNGVPVHPAISAVGSSIEMDDCTFTYQSLESTVKEKNVLERVSLKIGSGELVSVKGSVASGKTSLLHAMCGEVRMRSGTASVYGRIGYLEQSPYIMNSTLRDNVLFGHDFDEAFYWCVMKACALMEDIEQWPDRDMTLIGERGINISGGQKARLALARAVYTRADIYILDDPLSAVDAQVKRHLLDHVLLNTGLLGNKLRVVSMNSNHLDAFANQNITVNKGQITVKTQEHPRVHTIAEQSEPDQNPEPEDDAMSMSSVSTLISNGSAPLVIDSAQDTQPAKTNDAKKDINWGNLKYVVDTLGTPVLALLLFSAVFYPIVDHIAEGYKLDALNENSKSVDSKAINTYLWVQVLSASVDNFVRKVEAWIWHLLVDTHVKGRVVGMFARSLIYAPISLFDSTNKHEIDFVLRTCKNNIAGAIPSLTKNCISVLLEVSLSVYRIGYKAPLLLVIAPAMVFVMSYAARLVGPAISSLLNVMDSITIGISSIEDVISDSTRTIRIHGVEEHFTGLYADRTDEHIRLERPSSYLRSLSTTIERVIDVVTSAATTIVMVVQSQFTDYKLTSSELKALESLVSNMTSDLSNLVALRTYLTDMLEKVSKLRAFANTDPEKAWEKDGLQAPPSWPSHGEIEFRNYSMRYTPDHDLALKDISFTIKSGERIGIVGRTGAGKSSVTRALFRLVEGEGGSILVDGIDIATLRADSLRPNITIIPQDATLFDDSVRANLDPLRQFSIEDMWAALIKTDMVGVINSRNMHDKNADDNDDSDWYIGESKWQREKRRRSNWLMRAFLWFCLEKRPSPKDSSALDDWGLSYWVGGEALTSGQRQLFSLARALMRKRKILVLDEATADVDLKTDKIIHDVIHKEFAGCTILTIAHRLETVMSSDRIIVMDHGSVAEFDTPANLLGKGGLFAELVKSNNFGDVYN